MTKDLSQQQQQAISYLLGEISDAERAAIEERFFTDEDYSLFLDDVENDLIDEYARGGMDFTHKQKFEQNFLITERRREKTRLAAILQTEVFAPEKEKSVVSIAAGRTFWQTALDFFRLPSIAWAGAVAAVILLFLVGGLWLVRQPENVEVAQTGNENQSQIIEPTPAPTPTQANSQNSLPGSGNTQKIEQKPDAKPAPVLPKTEPKKPEIEQQKTRSNLFVAFTLLPPTRSSERKVLIVPGGAETIRLRVVHDNEEDFVKYRAEIRDSDGDLVWSREMPVSQKTLQKPITLNVRSGALASGAYELTLSGATADRQLEEINFYNFSVQKK